jgi:hypothetical protein
VNVLPYEIGISLGERWDGSRPNIRLAGNLGNFPAIPLAATARIGPVRPVFAWVKTDAPLILGQTNFFMEFDVCFSQAPAWKRACPQSSGFADSQNTSVKTRINPFLRPKNHGCTPFSY